MTLLQTVEENIILSKRDKKYLNINKKYKDLCKTIGEEKSNQWINKVCDITLKYQNLLSQRFCLYDTETTGIGNDDEIIELGILDSKLEFEYNQLFNPNIPILKAAENVHGISNDIVKTMPKFSKHQTQIQEFFDKYELSLAYNGEFDVRLIKQTCFSHNINQIKLPALYDPLMDMSLWCGNWNKKYSSFKYLKLEGGHRAIDDCKQMIKVIELISSLDVERLKHEYI
jgi:DNA polymerase-3 subunit epsilon